MFSIISCCWASISSSDSMNSAVRLFDEKSWFVAVDRHQVVVAGDAPEARALGLLVEEDRVSFRSLSNVSKGTPGTNVSGLLRSW